MCPPQPRWLRIGLVIGLATTTLAVVFMSVKTGGVFSYFDRRAVQKLLGVPLPAQVTDLYYAKWQPSTDLALYEAYIKFKTDQEAYLDLVRRLNLILFEASGPTAHLPTHWHQSPDFNKLAWWDPSPETPVDAASGTVGIYGWILMKYERGYVYIIISDTGQTAV